jgi:aconitate hydratase
MSHNHLNTLQSLPGVAQAQYYSLPELAKKYPNVNKLPHALRVVLESVLRNMDGKRVTEAHIAELANWAPNAERTAEIPFTVSRVVLQDLTGIPLLADLAAMRNVAQRLGKDPKTIEPLVPVDLVVDHSVMIDHYGTKDALDLNTKIEFERNTERYQFMKWGMQAFDTFKVVPPGIGIVHQVNLEYLARGVHHKNNVVYPDSLVGTDSHTTMINGIGVVAWGVGGIEAEAGMLGQPVYFLTPDVVGMKLTGSLREGVTATDLVLNITEILRKAKVVGKFVEFFGSGTTTLSVPDRATIANMAPEYGATMGFFPVDDATVAYLKATGRTADELTAFTAYFKAQNMYGVPTEGINYSSVVELDLASIRPSLAGPKRPQDRIEMPALGATFTNLYSKPLADNGFAKNAADLSKRVTLPSGVTVGSGDILIAAITSCTNTSNPSVLLAAGLLAQKAVARGLTVKPHVKTSLAPGSRVVTDYLTNAGLMPSLEALGFNVAGYGCTTCIGNGGDLTNELNEAIVKNDLVCAAVLSGNRNFEARIHANLRANFLASPPLVVAYAIAGTVIKNLELDPLGVDKQGQPVFLRDIWPTSQEIAAVSSYATDPEVYRARYTNLGADNAPWQAIEGTKGQVYDWPKSTYIAEPPFFKTFDMQAAEGVTGNISGMRAIGLFGDSITTDHISPASSIKDTGPAGKFLIENKVMKPDFNSYGSRRGNHEVMMRGTFANVRVKNFMLPLNADGSREEGGLTLLQPSGEKQFIYDAAQTYIATNTPTIVFAGEEYGTGSSRDWAAKGTALLGIKAVVARSFERIHRSNLVGMGVLPLQFKNGDSWQSLNIKGDETFALSGLDHLKPQQDATLTITRKDGSTQAVPLLSRIDTPIEVDYYQNGGILPYVLRDLLGGTAGKVAAAGAAVAGVAAVTAAVGHGSAAAVSGAATLAASTATTAAASVAASTGAAGAVSAGTAGVAAATVAAAATAAAVTSAPTADAPAGKGLPWWAWVVLAGLVAWLVKSFIGGAPSADKAKAAEAKPAATASSSATATAPVAAGAATGTASTATATAAAAPTASSAAPATASTAASPVAANANLPLAKLYFDVDKSDVKADEGKKLESVIAYLKTSSLARANISGYHDPSGNKAANEELAKNRAKQVREALKAAGISEDRIVMEKPIETTGAGAANAAEARRVEVGIRL